jgi:hypothetical protein
MTSRKTIAFFVLTLIAAAAGFLVGKSPAAGADAEPAKSPRSLLLVAAHPPRMLPSAAADRDNYQRYIETQCVLIKSGLVINSALQQREIAQLPAIKNQADPISWLEQVVKVTRLKDTELLQVELAERSGASGKDQAAIVNAVVRAYMEQVVNLDIKRRADRHGKLKKIRQTYAEILKERRETARKLSESLASGEPLTGPEISRLGRHRENLIAQWLKLRLDQSEAETLLARRKKAVGAASDQARKEIAQFEDRLAVLIDQQKILNAELEWVTHDLRLAAVNGLNLEELKDEIALMEEASRKVAAEVEALNVELDAPPRVRVLEGAVPPAR